MRIDKLFKVLVVGGSVLTAGCGDGAGAPTGASRAMTVEADVPDAASAQVDAGPADVGPTDVGADAQDDASADAGVLAWLSWV
ncbi:MAG: hypothetical protein EPO40_33895 [Myxococcaceae bacterium]|nr:MAG: hypothetical protein EPO40_33895 [Myxococcaceae bacterium]